MKLNKPVKFGNEQSNKNKRKQFPIDGIHIIELEKQRENLNKLTKEELIDYIMDLFRENPDLIIKEIETAGASDKNEKMELDDLIGKYREAAEKCFYVYERNACCAALDAEQKLDDLMDKASELAEKDKTSSIALFTAILESIDDNYGEVDDSEGGLGNISFMCQEELSNLLPK